MKLHGSKKLIIGGLAAVVVIAVIVIVLAMHAAANHSRATAQKAAASYTTAAHKYLTDVSTQLAVLDDFNHSVSQTVSADKQLQKLQASAPKLEVVNGAGAKLAAYTKAQAEQTKVAALQKAISAEDVAYQPFLAIIVAYNHLEDVQTDLTAGKLTTGDPALAVKDVILTPLTRAKAEFQKIKQPATYQSMALSIDGLFDDYINAGNGLLAAIQGGSTSSQNYSFSDQLYGLYDPIFALTKGTLQAPAAVAAQAKTLSSQY